MKSQLEKYKLLDPKYKNDFKSSSDKGLIQCTECEIDFKSEYHLDKHMVIS